MLPDALRSLDAAAARRWCAVGLAGLRAHQREIDELNVFPVPDGDTGTNLVLTATAAIDALAGQPPGVSIGQLLRQLAYGALLGARGNSGVILAQLYAGLADSLAAASAADGHTLAEALGVAARAAYRAVADPTEGTVLTVARAAADAAQAVADAAASDDLAAVVRAAASTARTALSRTPQQLPALARAGVVDAGGRGLVVLLDALVEVVTGQALPPIPESELRFTPLAVAGEFDLFEYAYEVQYLLDAEADAVERLKDELSELGDSLVVVGAEPIWNVHVHVDNAGAAIEAGIAAGRPYRITVTRLDAQALTATACAVAEPLDAALVAGEAGPAQRVEGLRRERAVVVVADGDGLAELFAAEGALVVSRGPEGAAPSTGEILAAIKASGAAKVVVIPNDSNIIATANAAAAQARSVGIGTGVVPTRSPVQALAALAVRNPARRFDDEVIVMAEAAGACRYAEVTIATREAVTVAGRCEPGDVLALVADEVNLIGSDLTETCCQLLDRLLAGGGELVTLLIGAPAPDGLAAAITAHLVEHWPFVEVQSYRGGQAHYPLQVGVE